MLFLLLTYGINKTNKKQTFLKITLKLVEKHGFNIVTNITRPSFSKTPDEVCSNSQTLSSVQHGAILQPQQMFATIANIYWMLCAFTL